MWFSEKELRDVCGYCCEKNFRKAITSFRKTYGKKTRLKEDNEGCLILDAYQLGLFMLGKTESRIKKLRELLDSKRKRKLANVVRTSTNDDNIVEQQNKQNIVASMQSINVSKERNQFAPSEHVLQKELIYLFSRTNYPASAEVPFRDYKVDSRCKTRRLDIVRQKDDGVYVYELKNGRITLGDVSEVLFERAYLTLMEEEFGERLKKFIFVSESIDGDVLPFFKHLRILEFKTPGEIAREVVEEVDRKMKSIEEGYSGYLGRELDKSWRKYYDRRLENLRNG